MKKILTLFFFILTTNTYAQTEEEYWANWDKNYPAVNILKILKSEKQYADSIEKHPEISPYYSRLDKFSFQAEYLGKTRDIDKDVLSSAKRVFKLFIGNPSQLDELYKTEVLFKLDNQEFWMPIQTNVLKALKKELKKGKVTTIYCIFLNEHTSKNLLYNTFLISEFKK